MRFYFWKNPFLKSRLARNVFLLLVEAEEKMSTTFIHFFGSKFLDFSLVFESFWLSLYCDISGVWRYEEICLLCSEKKGPKSIRLTGALGWRTRQVKLTDTLGWAVQWATVDSVTDDCHADRLAKAAWCAKLTGSQSWPARRVWIVFFLWTEEVHFYYSSIRSMEEIIFWGSVFFCFVVLRFFSSFLKS